MLRTTFAARPVIMAALLLAGTYAAAGAGIDRLLAVPVSDEPICESATLLEPDNDLAGGYRRAVVRQPADHANRRSTRTRPEEPDRHCIEESACRGEVEDRMAQRRLGAGIDWDLA